MRLGIFGLFLSICLSTVALSQAGGLSHVLRATTYMIHLETRLGYIDCDVSRAKDGSQDLIGCVYADGTLVSGEELVKLGLIEEANADAYDTQMDELADTLSEEL